MNIICMHNQWHESFNGKARSFYNRINNLQIAFSADINTNFNRNSATEREKTVVVTLCPIVDTEKKPG